MIKIKAQLARTLSRSIRPLVARTYSSAEATKLRWSYLQGSGPRPLAGATVGQLLEDTALQIPEREAFVFLEQKKRFTFSQLLEKSDLLAAGLRGLGLRPGDRVGIWSPNLPEWTLTQYAAARGGYVLVNLNPAYRTSEIEYALRKVGVKALLCPEVFKTTGYYSMVREICPELDTCPPGELKSERLPDLKSVILVDNAELPGTLRFSDVTSLGENNEHLGFVRDLQRKIQFDDPANIQFTSGTTGFPKGAVLSHHNIVNNAVSVGGRLRYVRGSVICSPVPFYHCFGTVMASLMTAVHGCKVVIPAGVPDPTATAAAVERERCISLYGTPTMFIDILNLKEFKNYDFSSLNTGIMAGSPCPPEVMKQVIEKMNMKDVTICYGTTENSPVTFQTTPEDSFERKVSTIGRPMPHTEVKVVDSDGHVVPVGKFGELMTRGACVMLGYYGDDEKTSAVLGKDRWYKTGDIVKLDEDGYGYIEGRISDMYIRGGENIYPVEVERVLHTHPDIVDVQIFGVPDPRLGEDGCACIIVRPGASLTHDDVKAFCKDKLTHFKVPHYIEYMDSFPMTVTKKVKKFELREQMTKKLNL